MNNKLKILSIICLTFISITCIDSVLGKTLAEYEKELEQIKKEQQAATNKLQGVEKQISQTIYDMLELDGEIGLYSIKLSELTEKTKEVNTKLEDYEKSLQNAALSYTAAQELYITRLRIIYENGMPTYLDILFQSEGIADFFSKMNVLNSILDYDRTLADNMQSQKEYIDTVTKDIEIQKTQLNQLTYDAKKSSEALELAKEAKENKVKQLNDSKELIGAYSKELAKQEQVAQDKIQEEIEKLQSTGAFSGQWFYPTPGFTIITARYGENYDPWNTGVTSSHGGADIAGYKIGGTPIHAMSDGKVVLSQGGWNYGYGEYVIIDHGTSNVDGNKYKSLYAHMRTRAVSVGTTVKKGDVIGYVGTSGNSTGDHLHLELYRNNKRMNALEMFPNIRFTYR